MPRTARPDADSRERLLQAGLALARKQGLRKLTVRAVAQKAGANLGSFVHHFGTRDAFAAELIERLYAPIQQRLQLGVLAEGDPLQRLRDALLQFVGWVVEQRAFIAHLMLDAGAGEVAAQRFLKGMDQRHPALLLQLVVQAQQAGRLRQAEPPQLLMFLMGSLAAPVMLLHLAGPLMAPSLAQMLVPFAHDIARIEQRLDWALQALAPQGDPT